MRLWQKIADGAPPGWSQRKKAQRFNFLLTKAHDSLSRGDGQRAEEYMKGLETLGVSREKILKGLVSACIINGRFSKALVYLNQASQRFIEPRLLFLAASLELSLHRPLLALEDARLLLSIAPTEENLQIYMKSVEAATFSNEIRRKYYLWAAEMTQSQRYSQHWRRKAQRITHPKGASL